MGRKEIEVVSFTINEQIRLLRRLLYTIRSRQFHEVSGECTEEQIDEALQYAKEGKEHELHLWLLRHKYGVDPEALPFSVLQAKARALGIENYSRMDKAGLLCALKYARNENEES